MTKTSKSDSPYIRPSVHASEGGVPIKLYGFTPVYQAPPELTDEHAVQLGNEARAEKMRLKTSREIKNNYLGTCTTRMPRVPECDYQPVLPFNLIDGNDDTCYCSHFRIRPDEYPVSIRIDFAKETVIKKVVIKKKPLCKERIMRGSMGLDKRCEEIGRAMARKIKIKASADAYEWTTLFDGDVERDLHETFEFSFSPTAAKQLVVEGDDLALCENWLYSFSVASIEVYDEKNVNIALHSKGACVTANSSNHLSSNERGAAFYNWLLQMDLGMKWARIGYHDDPINWHWVEREKGVLKMDPMAEDAIDVLYENGVNIVYCLNFGNRLYEGYAERRFPQLKEWYYENPRPPKSEEALLAWDRYIEFSVNYFKDRVSYFEIWNEWNGEAYWGDIPDGEHFIALVKRTIPIIRRCAPEAKIVMGSSQHFFHEQTPETEEEDLKFFYRAIDELAPLVDAIGYHPFYQPEVDGERYLNYTQNFNNFKKYCESRGFTKNVYMASEVAVGAMYPTTVKGTPNCWWGNDGEVNYSEIQKAKLLTQMGVKHTALGIQIMVCELSNHDYPLELSLLRKGFDTYPIQATNPSVAYYALRNLCTVLDGYEGTDFALNVSPREKTEIFTLKRHGNKAVALWKTHTVEDYCEGEAVDLEFAFRFDSARAYNVINGEVTPLKTELNGEKTLIKGIIVRDCPIILEIDE